MAAGILAAFLSAALGVAFFVFTKARYRKISRIAKQIDLVLFNADRFDLNDFDEGELSILHSEITKMTLRIREQNEMLKKDRQHLADSLADVAHQLRTPLTSATLILSLLAENPENPDESTPSPSKSGRKAHLYEIEELLMRMDWLITTLLKISRLDAGVAVFQNEPIRLSELLQSALRPLAIPLELRGVTVRLDVSEETLIKGDAGWLGEAFQNIFKNCMESVGEGKTDGRTDGGTNGGTNGKTGGGMAEGGADGKINSRADEGGTGGKTDGRADEGGTIEISCKKTPLFVEVTIRDNGAGFAKEDLPHVFDRFYRGENNNSLGYGIGLALSKSIITQQNGIISAYNHANGGAAFSVRFPCAFDL